MSEKVIWTPEARKGLIILAVLTAVIVTAIFSFTRPEPTSEPTSAEVETETETEDPTALVCHEWEYTLTALNEGDDPEYHLDYFTRLVASEGVLETETDALNEAITNEDPEALADAVIRLTNACA